ncbi:hypothetical protein ACFWFF_14400 [Streptomyces sp. NPDC060223]|uniref:hypothetical protein n=1 Tax=unclassified Streptomyces TaxID=2593676 RepID=UPI003628462F
MKHYPPVFNADGGRAAPVASWNGIKQVAADLGINPAKVRNWVRPAGANLSQGRRA